MTQAHDRYRAIFDSAVDFALIATDRDRKVTDWNRGAERILGWSAEDMRGNLADQIFTPEDRAAGRPDTEMQLALENGRAADERWHLRKDGSRFWASGELTPLRTDQGEHLGYLKILRDRTEEHRAEEALRSAEASLRRAQEAGGVGVFAVKVADDILPIAKTGGSGYKRPANLAQQERRAMSSQDNHDDDRPGAGKPEDRPSSDNSRQKMKDLFGHSSHESVMKYLNQKRPTHPGGKRKH